MAIDTLAPDILALLARPARRCLILVALLAGLAGCASGDGGAVQRAGDDTDAEDAGALEDVAPPDAGPEDVPEPEPDAPAEAGPPDADEPDADEPDASSDPDVVEPDAEPDASCDPVLWADTDGDGFGDPEGARGCEGVMGFVDNDADCDDRSRFVNPEAEDRPDFDFQDADCDGIDGNADALVFVAADGDDEIGEGTMVSPLRTIGAGLEVARGREGVIGVAVSRGSYAGQVALVEGISLFGGYDRASGWRRADGQVVEIVARAPDDLRDGRIVGVVASGIAERTEVALINVRVGDAGVAGASVYGIHALNAPGLALKRVNVSVGDAGGGSPGSAGDNGANGGNGSNGGNCGGGGGAGGPSPCGSVGGVGGFGGDVRTNGSAGEPPGCGGAGGPRGGNGADRKSVV